MSFEISRVLLYCSSSSLFADEDEDDEDADDADADEEDAVRAAESVVLVGEGPYERLLGG